MSKVFYAVNKVTGERWDAKRDAPRYVDQAFLVMYDSGYLAMATLHHYEGYSLTPLSSEVWETVVKDNVMNRNKG